MTLPSLFVAHGSPMLALEDNGYTRFLEQLGQELPKPEAIAVFSAHWDSPDQSVSVDESHGTMHDFYGFPEAMYELRYPAPGSASLTQQIGQLFDAGNLPYQPVLGRGLDHGVWVILQKMYPNADIPVVELSVDSRRSPAEQYTIGAMLKELRQQNVLVIGSGGLVHNLRMIGQSEEADPWAVEFDEWIAGQLGSWKLNELFDYDKKAPYARQAVPSYGTEHFVPLFYAMGAADDDRRAERLFQAYQYGSLSLNCWMFGS
ncbi:DODA-type extradiol aromatic ring-opening family dioxygenase [Paenibacillus chibensis]|uniref:DODA-type extradiol aromatic ring-opening family dioxygenase n=1 Tax=Paenibacillus chibensis TaxID=59846 RepID=UPI000FD9D682|nr:class III extradiol ring-cleavage dioxygenase [Paenibacillus chibensis]MEC0372613.1 class III extradiol ring-cleavage dioxygenase [Paenibacillus chibensis]